MHWQQHSKQKWICVFPSDVSPTGQGVDHRQVQRELGEVAVQLQEPATLTTASIRVSWTVSGSNFFVLFREGWVDAWLHINTAHMQNLWRNLNLILSFLIFPHAAPQLVKVDRQSQYVQGYRLFYRPSGGTWLLQDINSPSERSTVLTSLLKGTEYEIKIRPYFNEFQGKDSRTLLVRTPEEGNKSVELWYISEPERYSK